MTMDLPIAGSSRCGASSPTSKTAAVGDADPDMCVDEPTRRRHKMHSRLRALSEVDVVEDIIEGFSIASFNSLEDLKVCAVSVAVSTS